MYEEEQERLLSLLEQAETMEEIIALESRLTEVRYQLESMESQLRTMDNQVSYSTVYLSIEEVEHFTPPAEKGTWERISTGFSENGVPRRKRNQRILHRPDHFPAYPVRPCRGHCADPSCDPRGQKHAI